MSVVIIGGNERMVTQYENICKEHGCKAKVFAKENGSLKKKIGCPDFLILFISASISYISFFHIIIPGKTKDGKSAGIVYNEGEKDGKKK